jgi:hypothetical protein
MNNTDLQSFNLAVNLAQSGNKEQAYQQLKALEQTNYKEVDLLLWLTFTAPTIREAESYVEKISIVDPINPNLARAKQWVDERKIKLKVPKQSSPNPSIFNHPLYWALAIIIIFLFLLFLQTPLGTPIRDWLVGFWNGLTGK